VAIFRGATISLEAGLCTRAPALAGVTVRLRGIGTGISEEARGFLFFPLLPREASKRIPIFDVD
jgi:hypothetical protein